VGRAEAFAKCVLFKYLEGEAMDKCPVCGENLIHANVGDGSIDTYCEECGWPDEEIDEK